MKCEVCGVKCEVCGEMVLGAGCLRMENGGLRIVVGLNNRTFEQPCLSAGRDF